MAGDDFTLRRQNPPTPPRSTRFRRPDRQGALLPSATAAGLPLTPDVAAARRRVTMVRAVRAAQDQGRRYRDFPTALLTDTGSVTGTVSVTNANDTSAATGTTTITGSLARTNANDSVAAAGSPIVAGSLATTNANDSVVASGSVGSSITGTSATTNTNDTVASAGSPIVAGTSARTNANDSVAASGTTTVTGTSAGTNANDTVTASGTAGSVTGTSSTTNANDTVAASGVSGNETPPTGGTFGMVLFPPPRKKPPVITPLPAITGTVTVANFDDLSASFGVVDPFNLLYEDDELLVLV